MNQFDRCLIVGGGPVGLGAALFLARHGAVPRIIDLRDEPVRQSKALAVNPRTLEIFETTGVTEQMLRLGLPIRGVRMYRRERTVAAISLAGIHPRYPFMLALSQAVTERLLAQALAAAGGHVERGIKLVACRTLPDHVEATLEPTVSGTRETVRCPWLLAADGAHSTVREQLGSHFAGSSFTGEWYLADAPLRTDLAPDLAHVFFLDGGGFLFMIRVVDDVLNDPPGESTWRVITNRPEPLTQLERAEQAGPPLWASSFHIAHRIVDSMAVRGVYFAGDAAHVHSPMGARGMNLGLEDAWVFAELARAQRLAEYSRLRQPVDRSIVRQVEQLSRIVAAETSFYRFVRSFVFPTITKLPFLRGRLLRTLTGLDHELPNVADSTKGLPAIRGYRRTQEVAANR
jgi:2-polyprenyl-6-methoxyphenol hydroxylase-like FAD-dependent oxidoreductase